MATEPQSTQDTQPAPVDASRVTRRTDRDQIAWMRLVSGGQADQKGDSNPTAAGQGDGLRAARGIAFGLAVAVAFWLVITLLWRLL
jgi:hypothetical protein